MKIDNCDPLGKQKRRAGVTRVLLLLCVQKKVGGWSFLPGVAQGGRRGRGGRGVINTRTGRE